MAKKYTKAEWARIQSRLPEEERVPYSESPEAAPKADPLAELQASIAESKAQVKAKNIEVPTIALEQAVNSGDVAAIQSAATDLGKAQGLSGSELRTFAYRTAQDAAKGEKPTPPPADDNFVYDYVWRQDVGGPGGKWTLVRTPIIKTTDTTSTVSGNKITSGTSGTGGTTNITGAGGSAAGSASNLLAEQTARLATEEKTRTGQSAYDLLFSQFNQYGLGALVAPLRDFITEGLSPAEFTLRLRETDAYKKRFAANAQRVAKGLRAIDEATYIGLEDQYQELMRNYGLPSTYYSRGEMGRQEGFEKFIANDVSAAELEDRIQTAQNRIQYANPEVGIALRTFYPDITNGDLLAYALDPEKALSQIKRRITAAEIGASAVQLGLASNVTDAEYLARYGVTKEQAQSGYRNVAEVLPRASQLGEIYSKQGAGPYTQATATQEFFNVPGAADAAAKRRKLAELETASFSGQTGVGALARERAGQF